MNLKDAISLPILKNHNFVFLHQINKKFNYIIFQELKLRGDLGQAGQPGALALYHVEEVDKPDHHIVIWISFSVSI